MPTPILPPLPTRPKPLLWPWPLEWLMYLIATVNILLIMFDFTYFSCRDFYLTNRILINLESIVTWYDPYKGAEPNFYNQDYLQAAQKVKLLFQKNPQDPAISPLLASLQAQSKYLIDENPYELVGKTGTLEKLKNRIRRQMKNPSATQSFQQFWSTDYLSASSLAYYEKELQPLIRVNYFRKYGEDGEFIDRFWQIDLYFMGIFAFELLLRSYYMSVKLKISYREALALRWYDFLWFTFSVHWDWLRLFRFIPYAVRSDQLGAPFSRLVDYINIRFIQYLAAQVTDLVVIRILDEVESGIRATNYNALLIDPQASAVPNRVTSLLERQANTLVQRILPELEPELVALVQHTLLTSLEDNPGYRYLKPLLGSMPPTALEMFLRRLYRAILHNLQGSKLGQDSRTPELTAQLSQKLLAQLRAQNTLADFQDLLIALVEDVKRNYLAQHREKG